MTHRRRWMTVALDLVRAPSWGGQVRPRLDGDREIRMIVVVVAVVAVTTAVTVATVESAEMAETVETAWIAQRRTWTRDYCCIGCGPRGAAPPALARTSSDSRGWDWD